MKGEVKSFKTKFGAVKFFVRNGTLDEYIVREVFKRKGGGAYQHLNIQKGDRVLDLGLNIGTFTVSALLQGAAMVEAYEPMPDNFDLAMHNIIDLNGLEEKFLLHRAAVVGEAPESNLVSFYVNLKKNKGIHSTLRKRGREEIRVPAIPFQEVLSSFRPDVIKMDIDGGEYDCLNHVDLGLLAGVRSMVIEYHHDALGDIPHQTKFKRFIGQLAQAFDIVLFNPEPGGNWTTTVHCTNTPKQGD